MLERKELTTLLINVISVKMLLTFPRTMVMNSGNSAWIEAVYNTLVMVLIFWVTTRLYRGKKNVIQIAEAVGKKGLKIVVGILVFVILMINFSYVIRVFPETVKIVLLQDFKVEIIIAVFIIAAAVGAYIGLKPIAKINNIFMPIAGAVLVLALLMLIPYYKTDNILPVFGNGFKSIFADGFHGISLFSDILLLNILLPNCENNYEAKKSGWRAIFISATIAIVILLAYCLVYPYPASAKFMVPVYQLARVIHLSSFFSRFEVVFQFVWSILVLLYAAIYVYAICYVWQITFNLKYYKPLIFPIVIISGVIAILPNSVVDLVRSEKWEDMLVYPAAFLLPIIFGFFTKKIYGGKEISKEEEGIE
ncbi:MAG: spore germination protein [Oscillospiraceae bacterium]|nr:spore germination protein [Oscillospiraceae bacterium]